MHLFEESVHWSRGGNQPAKYLEMDETWEFDGGIHYDCLVDLKICGDTISKVQFRRENEKTGVIFLSQSSVSIEDVFVALTGSYGHIPRGSLDCMFRSYCSGEGLVYELDPDGVSKVDPESQDPRYFRLYDTYRGELVPEALQVVACRHDRYLYMFKNCYLVVLSDQCSVSCHPFLYDSAWADLAEFVEDSSDFDVVVREGEYSADYVASNI